MRKIFTSFSARLTFYVLLLTTLIFLGIVLVFNSFNTRHEAEHAERYTSALQQNINLKIDNDLSDVEEAMHIVQAQVGRHVSNTESVDHLLQRVLEGNKLLKGVGVAFRPDYYGAGGNRLNFDYFYRNDSTRSIEYIDETKSTSDYTQRDWFKNALATGKETWRDPYRDSEDRRECLTSFVLPCIDDEGEVYAVLLADVELTDLTIDLNRLQPYDGSYSFIISRDGKYVAHPNRGLILRESIYDRARELGKPMLDTVGRRMVAGQSGTVNTSIEDDSVMICFAPMTQAGWYVGSVNPYRSITSQLGSTTYTVLIILLVGLLILLVCVRLLINSMLRPVKKLTDAAHLIARGNFSVALPRVETNDDIRKLHDAFHHMQESLGEYTRELETTTRAKERIESELHIARNIQMSLVPKMFSPFLNCEELEIFASLKPAKEVGGDFYDFILRGGRLKFVIGDVSGKGIPASLVMVITSTLFRVFANSTDSPAEIVSRLNNAIAENNEACMFVTFFCGELDLSTGCLTFCNAGHNAPIVAGKDGKSYYLPMDSNLPLGIVADYKFGNQQVDLPKGSAMLLYTDGLTEGENADKELFGEERTLQAAQALSKLGARDIVNGITEALGQFVGEAEQSDDLTLLCVRLNEAPTDVYENSLRIANDMKESVKLTPFVEDMANALSLSDETKDAINLALEEALVNVILYAYPEGEQGFVTLTARADAARTHIRFELRDSGKAYNPLLNEMPDLTLGIEERPIGGLGIFLIRKMMDELAYDRLDGDNVLIMRKNL